MHKTQAQYLVAKAKVDAIRKQVKAQLPELTDEMIDDDAVLGAWLDRQMELETAMGLDAAKDSLYGAETALVAWGKTVAMRLAAQHLSKADRDTMMKMYDDAPKMLVVRMKLVDITIRLDARI